MCEAEPEEIRERGRDILRCVGSRRGLFMITSFSPHEVPLCDRTCPNYVAATKEIRAWS